MSVVFGVVSFASDLSFAFDALVPRDEVAVLSRFFLPTSSPAVFAPFGVGPVCSASGSGFCLGGPARGSRCRLTHSQPGYLALTDFRGVSNGAPTVLRSSRTGCKGDDHTGESDALDTGVGYAVEDAEKGSPLPAALLCMLGSPGTGIAAFALMLLPGGTRAECG